MNRFLKLNIFMGAAVVLTSEVGGAQYYGKTSFDLKLDKFNWSKYNKTQQEQLALSAFKNNGIYVDKYSHIHITEEKNHVDLRCFDCISKRVGSGHYEHSSDNKEVFQP